MIDTVIREIAKTVDSEEPREARARAAAELIRSGREYRWVGIYDVDDEEIALLGHTGDQPPAHPRFPMTQGLSGEAVRTRCTIVSNDVSTDVHYLVAFETTGSECIVPILGAESGIVIGTVDAESDRTQAFSPGDVDFLESCAAALRPLYD